MKSFPALILAGGLATRLRPKTETLPKCLIEISGAAFVDHQLRLLYKQGVREVVLCVGYLGEMIEAHVGNGERFGLNVCYSYDGSTLLGTGGAIKKALPLISGPFFVLYGDSYLTCDYAAVQAAFQSMQKLGLMTLFHNQGQWDTSNVEYCDNTIITYDKKNRTERMEFIDYGLGVFSKQAFSKVPDNIPYDLALLYQDLLQQNQLGAFEVHERFYEAGSQVGIAELEAYLS